MVRQLKLQELLDLFQAGEKFVLIDVLSRESFEKEHIRGAISIPLDEIGGQTLRNFDKDIRIVTYCANFDCQASTKAAEKLIELGFKDVWDFKGGLKEYKEAGLTLGRGREGVGVCAGSECCCG